MQISSFMWGRATALHASKYSRGNHVYYRGGQRFAHKNTKMQFLENKYAVWLYKSYQNEKRFLKLSNDSSIIKYIL